MQPMQSNVHGGRGDVLTGWAQHFNATFNTEDWSIDLTFHNKATQLHLKHLELASLHDIYTVEQ